MSHDRLSIEDYLISTERFPPEASPHWLPYPRHHPVRRPPVMHQAGLTDRREFTRNALQSLTTLVLIEGLWSRRLLGEDVRPIVDSWFKDLNAISHDVHEHRK